MRMLVAAVGLVAGFASAQEKTDALTAYTVCIAAIYQELAEEGTKPLQTFIESRQACDKLRSNLEQDLRPVLGEKTAQTLLQVDVEMVKALSEGPPLVLKPCKAPNGVGTVRSGATLELKRGEVQECYDGEWRP